jgi:hypothetical protein
MVLLRVATQVGEGEHGDRWPIGEGKRDLQSGDGVTGLRLLDYLTNSMEERARLMAYLPLWPRSAAA